MGIRWIAARWVPLGSTDTFAQRSADVLRENWSEESGVQVQESRHYEPPPGGKGLPNNRKLVVNSRTWQPSHPSGSY